MSSLETARHALPLLAVSQAQKEITHNEALVRIDALLHTVVIDELAMPPSLSDADIGKCWLVAPSAGGDWLGRGRHVALWVGGSWRFLQPIEGMRVRQLSLGVDRIWSADSWRSVPTVSDPANGALADVEARQSIVALLQYLRSIGLIAS
ncbi:MAG: DUF2793 domain-containing protein [Sphingomonadaceae bacterium]|nr:DUF2793 domain-containing protein [Sphingomonadaceae bacterium]